MSQIEKEMILNSNADFWTISKRIFSLALPMAGSQLINVASGFLCMAMLAQLGHDVLAASALIFSTQISIMVSGMAILFSLSVLVGHAYGGKEYAKIGNYVQQGWTLSILISIPIMILFWNINTLLLFFGQSPQIAEIVKTYFHAYMWGVIPGFLACCNQQFGYGIQRKMLMVLSSVLSIIVLLMTAYAFIFGKLNFPALGVAGLGYAIAIQYTAFFLFTTVYFYLDENFSKFELFKYRVHQHWNHLVEMFQIGWPICVQVGGEMLSFFVSGIMIGWLGTTALASFQIVNQYYFLIVIPVFTLAQASGILVGHARGAEQYHEIKKLSHASIAIALLICVFVAATFLLFPTALASFYINVNDPANEPTLHLTILIFAILAFSQIFDNLRNTLVGLLRGLFDTRFPMYMSLVTIWLVGMPLSYLLAFPFHFGVGGFVMGGLLGMLSGVMVMLYRWHKISKKF